MGLNIAPLWSRNNFKADWSPTLPKLKVLELTHSFWLDKEQALKFVNGAPNLQKVKGNFCAKDLKVFPKAVHALLDWFTLSIEERGDCWDFAESGPGLSLLKFSTPSEQHYRTSFLRVLNKLLSRNWYACK